MFVKITKAFGHYVEGNVHEVNANRGGRFISDGNAEECKGPATVLPGSVKVKPSAKSSATAATASPPGKKVKK